VSHYQLDARFLLCPMPVIRVQDKVATLAPGDTVEVTCTDPGALYDIPAWCKVHGHEVVSATREERTVSVTVRVCDAD
jgi:tRNA 2-thiouridine synthesizing protein A